jgi:hypothetical protein
MDNTDLCQHGWVGEGDCPRCEQPNTLLIANIEQAIEATHEALENFYKAQNEFSDKSNGPNLVFAFSALIDLAGAVSDLVP